ncbi:MAG: hypothetical protein ACLQM6_09995 [Acidobacteriaceae bacterium]
MADAAITKRVFQELIAHRSRAKATLDLLIQANPDLYPKGCLIAYGDIATRAGYPELTRTIGIFLGEVAEICAQRGWPPLNALAVNRDTRMPGEGFDLAENCNIDKWPSDVARCMECDLYAI